jgi:hypothetical protein
MWRSIAICMWICLIFNKMNILKWVHKWTRFLQFHPFRWNVMAAHFFYSRITLFRISNQKYKYQSLQNHICLKLPVLVVICLKNLDNFTKTCMILTVTFSSIHKLKWPVLLSYLREWNQTGTELTHVWRTKYFPGSKQILLYGSDVQLYNEMLFKIILNLYTCIQHTSTQPNIKRQNYIKVPGKYLVRQTCVNSVPVWFHSRK